MCVDRHPRQGGRVSGGSRSRRCPLNQGPARRTFGAPSGLDCAAVVVVDLMVTTAQVSHTSDVISTTSLTRRLCVTLDRECEVVRNEFWSLSDGGCIDAIQQAAFAGGSRRLAHR